MGSSAEGVDPTFDTEWLIQRDSDGDIRVFLDTGYLSEDGAISLASDILEVAGVQWTPLS